MNILILFAHPAQHKSRVNRQLARAVREVEGVTFHDLYDHYPEFDIDVQREQQLLLDHDIVVMQHPLYWYSTPAILKEWQDLVLQHGWAYGSQGHALEGKQLVGAISTGASEASYSKEGANGFTLRECLVPIEMTARLCGMQWRPPFVVHKTHALTDAEVATHAEDYRRLVVALRDGQIDFEIAEQHSRLNPAPGRIVGLRTEVN